MESNERTFYWGRRLLPAMLLALGAIFAIGANIRLDGEAPWQLRLLAWGLAFGAITQFVRVLRTPTGEEGPGGANQWMGQAPGAAAQKARGAGKEQSQSDPAAEERPSVTFADVAGLDDVLDDLKELVEFVRDRSSYVAMGATLPRGVLLYGPPGTGKTLIAKAIAGESGAAFFHASGASFVEKYVGVGAGRVRELFRKAKKHNPAIVFIDEFDAVARSRDGGDHREHDSTLNQLLVELDGFETTENVLLVAATNRRELLDEAVLRPGRLDRQVYIGLPDLSARERILGIHLRNKPRDEDLNVGVVARRTAGLAGAHLAAVANEAAIAAVREGAERVAMNHLLGAIDRIIAGRAQRRSLISADERRRIAVHESGHAVASWATGGKVIEKISLLPSSQALGYVINSPAEEKVLHTQQDLLNEITVLLAGRAAEQFVLGDVSTGAANDLERATNIAEQMVLRFGMSARRSHQVLKDEALLFNPRVERDVQAFIRQGWELACDLMQRYNEWLLKLAAELSDKETLGREEVEQILAAIPRAA